MKAKLKLLAAISHDAKLLILDEPFTGLDPINVKLLKDAIYDLQKKGTSIIFSSHQMEHVEEFCEKLVILVHGHPVLEGYLKQIKKDYRKKNIVIQGKFDPKKIEKIKGVLSVTKEHDEYVVKISDESVVKDVFHSFSKSDEITKFVTLEPSLNEIFIEKVGAHYDE